MEYISTRNNKKTFTFEEVFLKGLASDGGLFIPKSIKKFTKEEKSSPSPILFNACIFAILSAIFSFLSIGAAIFDWDKLGAIQLTLIFGANSAANETVNPSTAALVEAIIAWLVNPRCAATVENKTT